MQRDFLAVDTRGGEKLAHVRFNNGVSKPMKRAGNHCLKLTEKWYKSLHRLPTKEEWAANPSMFDLQTVEELFGSFDAMLDEMMKKQFAKPPVRTGSITVTQSEEVKTAAPQEDSPAKEKQPDGTTYYDYDFGPLAEALRGACRELGHVPTHDEYSEWRKQLVRQGDVLPSVRLIRDGLGRGDWDEALQTVFGKNSDEESSVDVVVEEEPMRDPLQEINQMIDARAPRTPYTAEWLIRFLHLLHEHLGRIPKTSDLQKIKRAPDRKAFANCFGGWAEALLAANLITQAEADELIARREKRYAWRYREKEEQTTLVPVEPDEIAEEDTIMEDNITMEDTVVAEAGNVAEADSTVETGGITEADNTAEKWSLSLELDGVTLVVQSEKVTTDVEVALNGHSIRVAVDRLNS